nr:zinc finger, CCHC-type [Tanacetum cinerariifolium]
MPTPKAQKIGPKIVDCIFTGYAKNSSAYCFIIHDSNNPDIQKNTVMEISNASFFENIFPCLMKETRSSSSIDNEVVKDKRQRDDNDLQDERQNHLEEVEVKSRRSKRARIEKSFRPDFVSFMTIKSTKDMLKSKFDMKDMGLADVIRGIKITRTQNGLVLSQAHYVEKILNTHNMGDSGLARTLIDTSTRPDLAYVVRRLSMYTSNLSDAHWKAMTMDSRLTSGYVFTLGGDAISWKSSKQTIIAQSMMESEFITLDKCREKAKWIRQFIENIPRGKAPVLVRLHNPFVLMELSVVVVS